MENMKIYNALVAAKLAGDTGGGGGNIASSNVTAMTGYAKAETAADISTSDSLNAAMGKVEKRVSDNENNISKLDELLTEQIGYKIISNFAYGTVKNSMTPTQVEEYFKYILVDIDTIDEDFKIVSTEETYIPMVWVNFYDSSGTLLLNSYEWRSDLENFTIRPHYEAYPTARYIGLTFCYTEDGTTSTIVNHIPLSGITLQNNAAKTHANLRNDVTALQNAMGSLITVDKSGLGQYTTVSAAVAAAHDGDTIYINSGIYDEHINMNGKNIHLVGRSKYSTLLVRSSKLYDDEPLAANIGSISNLTLIAGYGLTINEDDQDAKAYALHVEQQYATPYELTIDNCILISNCAPAIGIGCRVNQTVNIKNSKLVTTREKMYSTYRQEWYNFGALYVHNDATTARGTDGKVIIDNCEFQGNKAALTLYSLDNDNTLTMRFTENLLWTTTYGKTNTITLLNTSTAADHLAGNDIVLDDISFGNNIADINA